MADRLVELANALGLAQVTDPAIVAVARLLGTLRERSRWLLIFDNAEDPAALARYLLGGGGHVVITSRNPSWRELATPVGVDVFAREESITLLHRCVPQLTDGEAGQIAQALGDLPLALAQAAAHLADTFIGVEGYLSLLAERTTELLDQGSSVTYPVSLAASVQIALDRLVAQSPAALQLLTLAAYLAPEPISLTLFTTPPTQLPDPLATAATDPLAFAELPRLLRRHGLARVESATLALHRLLAAILRTQSHSLQDLPALVVRLLRAALAADDPCDNPQVWPAWCQLLPHVLVATDSRRALTGVEEDVVWLFNRAAKYLQAREESAFALPLHEASGACAALAWATTTLTHWNRPAVSASACGGWGGMSRLASSPGTPSPAAVGSWAMTTPTPWNRPPSSPSPCGSWGSMSRPASSPRTPSPAPVEPWAATIPSLCGRPAISP